MEKHSEQVHAIDQVRHSSGQVSYDFCPFSSKELLAQLFFMYAMLQSLWLQFCHLLSLTSSSKTTLSPRTSSSTPIGPVNTHGPWRRSIGKGPIFISSDHHSSSKCIPGHHAQDLYVSSGCDECHWGCFAPWFSCVVVFLLHYFLFIYFVPQSPSFFHFSSTLLIIFSLSVIHLCFIVVGLVGWLVGCVCCCCCFK